ncbi:MAG TPA: hypothetical protein VLI04_02475 [Nocardioidaceae bacterium]|nr:hypothetical protein [Nocardioidaceae bacterium]
MATRLVLGVSEDDSDDVYLDELARQLRTELLETDVESVEPLSEGEAPEGTRSELAIAAGALVATVAPLGLQGAVGVVQEWLKTAVPGRRTVRLEIGGDVLELGGIDATTQQSLIADWVKRHDATPA